MWLIVRGRPIKNPAGVLSPSQERKLAQLHRKRRKVIAHTWRKGLTLSQQHRLNQLNDHINRLEMIMYEPGLKSMEELAIQAKILADFVNQLVKESQDAVL